MAIDRLQTAAARVRRGLLGLAVAVPMLAAATLLVYLIEVDPKQSVKLALWGRLLQVMMLAWLIYLADVALDRRLSPGGKLSWAIAVLVAWPLAMPLYLLARVSRFGQSPPRRTADRTPSGPAADGRRLPESERIEAALAELEAQGLSRREVATPIYRLAWRVGWPVPPPPFQTVLEIVRLQGLGFAIFFDLVMWGVLLGAWGATSFPGVTLAATCLVIMPVLGSAFGLLFALPNALFARRRRRRLGLPLWQEYVPARPAGRTGEPPG